MKSIKSEHQYRKDKVLGIVVNEYIKTVNPVSSGFIVQEYPLDLSSATIRNILAELEEEGYLMHPHTSAGRMPTQEGYRYYVDNLMNEIQLLGAEKQRIRQEYFKEACDLENLLEKTSEAISDLTHYTSIISIDGKDRMFCRGTNYVVQYSDYQQDLHRIQSILEALEKKERILHLLNQGLQRKIQIYIGHELAHSNIQNCSLAVSRYEAHNGTTGRIAVLGPTRMDYQKVVSTLDYISQLMKEIL